MTADAPDDEELEHFSKNSMMGWMMSANTCAPCKPKDGRHLATQVADIINPPGDSQYESTNTATFRGWEGSQLKNAKLPQKLKYQDPQTFVDEGNDPNRYQSSSRQFFRDPKQGRPEYRTRRSNDPSELDHPMLGLMNPKRAEVLAKSGSHYNSTSQASYTQKTYVYEGMRKIDPYSHSSDIGWDSGWKMKDQQTESRARYQNFPGSAYTGRVKSTKTFQSEFSLQ